MGSVSNEVGTLRASEVALKIQGGASSVGRVMDQAGEGHFP